MCKADGSLVEPITEDKFSPQTDVILYDASHACPFYRLNDIAVVAARDVLGFVEVKDRNDRELALHNYTSKAGAISHLAQLAKHAPDALRAVVLLRGKGVQEAHDKCKDEALTSLTVPHVIYCVDMGYVAVYEYTSHEVHFFDHGKDGSASALADFLRVLASFFPARGLASASVALGLSSGERLPQKRKPKLSLKLEGRAPLPSLRDMIDAHEIPTVGDKAPSFENKLKSFMSEHVKNVYCTATTGRDLNGDVSAGIAVVAHMKGGAPPDAASFFVVTQQGLLNCVDPAPDAGPTEANVKSQVSWIITHERPEAYFRRVCDILPWSYDPFQMASATVQREEP
jgi:hypothetical protein